MKIKYQPTTKLEKFGFKIQKLLVENFSETYFVGGTVRDILLKRKFHDIDLATAATPLEVVDTFKKYFVQYNIGYQNMGIVIASEGDIHLSVATFRKDLPSDNRYPEVQFTRSIKVDAKRRDFTINALYLEPNTGVMHDFYDGLGDIKKKRIKFIGMPKARIQEDPLRIIRALRFALTLNFKIEPKTFSAIKNNFKLTSTLTESRMQKEIEKVESEKLKKILQEVINKPELLDKHF